MKLADSRLIHLAIGAALAFIVTAGARQGNDLASVSASCRPSFSKVSGESLSVQSGNWEFRFNALLIGCKQDIASLRPSEIRAIQDILRGAVKLNHLHTERLAGEAGFRKELVRRIQAITRREAVTDVFVFITFSAERM